MDELFSQIITDIERVNDIDTKTIPEKVFKFNEEFGEFITELGKSIGMTHKVYDEPHLIEESADALTVIISIILISCKLRNIPFQKVLEAMPEKIKKWETMCQKYTRGQQLFTRFTEEDLRIAYQNGMRNGSISGMNVSRGKELDITTFDDWFENKNKE